MGILNDKVHRPRCNGLMRNGAESFFGLMPTCSIYRTYNREEHCQRRALGVGDTTRISVNG